MQIITTLFLVVSIIIFPVIITLLLRNDLVYTERKRVIDWIYKSHDQNQIDERERIYEMYTYDEMVYKFWIPVKSFYAEYME